MNRALWILQILLAAAFGMAGVMKLTTSIDDLLAMGMAWVTYTPEGLVRFIGVAEAAGAVGLILPAALRIQPKLTPLAAALLALVMVLAAIMHGSHAEWPAVPPNVVLGALAAFVAWGRWSKAPILPKEA